MIHKNDIFKDAYLEDMYKFFGIDLNQCKKKHFKKG